MTFTPYYVIINNASFAMECQENDRPGDSWLTIEPKSCSALWPKSELDDKLLKLRVKDTDEVSAGFLYTESHTSLLKLKNKVSILFLSRTISSVAFLVRWDQRRHTNFRRCNLHKSGTLRKRNGPSFDNKSHSRYYEFLGERIGTDQKAGTKTLHVVHVGEPIRSSNFSVGRGP